MSAATASATPRSIPTTKASNPRSPHSCRCTAAEINHLSVRNNTGEAVTVDVTGCVEWCLWNAVDDASNFQRNLSTGEVEVEQTGTNTIVYHKTEFKERRNHYAFFSVNEPTVGFDTSRDEFLGQFNGWDSPQAIAEGRMRDSVAHGWYPIAAERVRLTLQPGEAHARVHARVHRSAG